MANTRPYQKEMHSTQWRVTRVLSITRMRNAPRLLEMANCG
ncbi:hypothetical protein K788_0002950 [Paraburkholderia caribensis MBA4]|uniref:Uncharacterized protein n=1 Tax=Paraburkholderia caribensis MBA4 TaxID=1323664 RepID=A0A0P0REQ1_9BURK|nr:hypothetical protein K788_0002950 [Paraburkholderia caribensis MBA4]